jgi:hypothetical protein
MSLPRVPLESANERQHRTVIATTVNELVKVRPPFDTTEDEAAAGVRPIDHRYAPGDDRRYNTLADFCKVVSRQVEGHLWTDHTISVAHDITGDASILVHGRRTITATSVMDYMLKHSGKLRVEADGELLFDGDNKVTFACLHSTNIIPNLRNVRFLDATNGLLGGDSDDGETFDDVTGDAVWDTVIAENCADVGYALRGHATAASRTAKLELRNCQTKGTTGSGDLWSSGNGFLLHFSGFKSIRFIGGDFTGHADAIITNAYQCSQAEVHGGNYRGVARGPTIGNTTQNFVIDGTTCTDISGNAVNADTTDGSNPTAGIGRISGNVMNNCGRAVRTTCSFVSVTDNEAYECGATQAFAFAGTGDSEVWLDGNHCYDATTGFTAFYAVGTTTVTVGSNYTNSTSRTAYLTDDGALFKFTEQCGNAVTLTTSGDLSAANRVIVFDCTAGTVDLDLFDETEIRATGFQVYLIKIDTANTATLTFQGGASNGETINGGTSITIPAAHQYRRMQLLCTDGTTGTWIQTPPPPQAYSVSNLTSDRAFDADTVAIAELADVVGTLITDLKLR